jgi:hypothetical protein
MISTSDAEGNPRSSSGPEKLNWKTELINVWTRCNADEAPLGYYFQLEECARACHESETCTYFMHDSNDGECIESYTESVDCPEGLESSSYYHFFAIKYEGDNLETASDSESDSEGPKIEANIVLISEGFECMSESV